MEAQLIDSTVTTGANAHAALEISGLSKHFDGVRALHDVSLTVRAGEVHGLLGQNGSGKSTLIKILAGFHAPDPGARLRVGGQTHELPLPSGEFRKIGIAFVHQHLGLVPSMSVLENLLIGEHATHAFGYIDWAGAERRARALFVRFGLTIQPATLVEELSSVEKALLAIVRAFNQLESANTSGPRLLILDEPTPFLPAQDVYRLFGLVRAIVAQGASVIFVSHDIDEILEITDRLTVLRDGVLVGTLVTRQAQKADIVQMIIGRSVDFDALRAPQRALGEQRLQISGLRGKSVAGFSLQARAGEVIGLTGLLDSGYEDVIAMSFGATPVAAGSLTLDGTSYDLRCLTPHAAIGAGIVLIPSDRLVAGVVPSLSVADNATLPILKRFARGFFIPARALRQRTEALTAEFEVRPRDPGTLMAHLSGGNQQKVVLSKWFQLAPRLVLLSEPTQGIDVGARERVFTEIHKMAANGATVLCASSDHEQLVAICDRVLVLARGAVCAELKGVALSKAAIGERCYAAPVSVS